MKKYQEGERLETSQDRYEAYQSELTLLKNFWTAYCEMDQSSDFCKGRLHLDCKTFDLLDLRERMKIFVREGEDKAKKDFEPILGGSQVESNEFEC